VATLQTFPGVVRVLDQLEVDANMGASAPGASVVPNPGVPGEVPAGASSNGAELSPTGRPVTPVPRAFPGAPTNAVVPGATPR
jgi:hypothetical protein